MRRFMLGNYAVEFDDDVEYYAPYIAVFSEMAYFSAREFRENLDSCENAEVVLKKSPMWAEEQINKSIQFIVSTLIKNGIMEYDVRRIKATAGEQLQLESYDSYVNLWNQYNEIYDKQAIHMQQKTFSRSSRSRWYGGGFGISGAIKGSIKAGTLNLVTDTVRAIGDMSADSADEQKFDKMKRKLLTEQTLEDLSESVFACIDSVSKDILLMLLEKHTGRSAEKALGKNAIKANAIFENIKHIEDVVQKRNYLLQIIEIDPFEWGYIKYLLDSYRQLQIPFKDAKELAKFVNLFYFKQWQCEDFGEKIDKFRERIATQADYEELKLLSIENGYISEECQVISQKYPFCKRAPQVAVRMLVNMAIEIRYGTIKNTLDFLKRCTVFELQDVYDGIKSICIAHNLIKDQQKFEMNTVFIDESASSKSLQKLIKELNKKYDGACIVEEKRFESLKVANMYRQDLDQFKNLYYPGKNYADYEYEKMQIVLAELHSIDFNTEEIHEKIEALEGKALMLEEHEKSDEYRNGKVILAEFQEMDEDNLYIYGKKEFLKAAKKVMVNKIIGKVEPDSFPLLIYDAMSGNGIKGFVITEKYFYDLGGILGFGDKYIELNQISSLKLNSNLIEFLMSNGKRIKVKLPELLDAQAFIEKFASSINLPVESIVSVESKSNLSTKDTLIGSDIETTGNTSEVKSPAPPKTVNGLKKTKFIVLCGIVLLSIIIVWFGVAFIGSGSKSAEHHETISSVGNQFEAGWIYGTYEYHGDIDAVAELEWSSGDNVDYITLNGVTKDGSSVAEFLGYVVSSKDNTYTAIDEYDNVVMFYYNGIDKIEIKDSPDIGGMYFPGFDGVYHKTKDLSHDVS